MNCFAGPHHSDGSKLGYPRVAKQRCTIAQGPVSSSFFTNERFLQNVLEIWVRTWFFSYLKCKQQWKDQVCIWYWSSIFFSTPLTWSSRSMYPRSPDHFKEAFGVLEKLDLSGTCPVDVFPSQQQTSFSSFLHQQAAKTAGRDKGEKGRSVIGGTAKKWRTSERRAASCLRPICDLYSRYPSLVGLLWSLQVRNPSRSF